MKLNIPTLLILFRLLLAPIILLLAYHETAHCEPIIVTLMFLGLISDILDGIIARKQNISSAKLRRMDSQVDMLFWLSIGFATYFLYPALIKANIAAIIAILGMEVACYVISLIKFKKETCTHAFLSKMWGIALLVAFTSLIGFNHSGVPFQIAIILGLISHIDRILITLILPKWTHDIPSTYHAYLIRKGIDFKCNEYLNG
ncbi:MAG: CDP-alcohol phosphatidyltransferase family protein [Nonlabens sp.]